MAGDGVPAHVLRLNCGRELSSNAGPFTLMPLEGAAEPGTATDQDLSALDDALNALAAEDERIPGCTL